MREGINATSTAPWVDLRNVHTVIAHPRDRDGEILIRHLQRLGSRVVSRWPPGDLIEPDADLLLCLIDAAARPLLDAAAEAGLAMIGVVNSQSSSALRLLDEAPPHAVIMSPLDPAAVTLNIVLAQTAAKQQRRQLGKIAKLEETLRSCRKVEQAKAILMKQRKIGEPEAYTYLRDQAMRRRVPVGVVAGVVVDSTELLSDDSA